MTTYNAVDAYLSGSEAGIAVAEQPDSLLSRAGEGIMSIYNFAQSRSREIGMVVGSAVCLAAGVGSALLATEGPASASSQAINVLASADTPHIPNCGAQVYSDMHKHGIGETGKVNTWRRYNVDPYYPNTGPDINRYRQELRLRGEEIREELQIPKGAWEALMAATPCHGHLFNGERFKKMLFSGHKAGTRPQTEDNVRINFINADPEKQGAWYTEAEWQGRKYIFIDPFACGNGSLKEIPVPRKPRKKTVTPSIIKLVQGFDGSSIAATPIDRRFRFREVCPDGKSGIVYYDHTPKKGFPCRVDAHGRILITELPPTQGNYTFVGSNKRSIPAVPGVPPVVFVDRLPKPKTPPTVSTVTETVTTGNTTTTVVTTTTGNTTTQKTTVPSQPGTTETVPTGTTTQTTPTETSKTTTPVPPGETETAPTTGSMDTVPTP